MSLELVCRIDADIGQKIISEIVPNDIISINNKLLEMKIPNTTGLDPINDKKFERQMKRLYKKIKSLSFTSLARDTETEVLYILTKESDYNVKEILRSIRKHDRIKTKNKMASI